jgi:hypothetical protein
MKKLWFFYLRHTFLRYQEKNNIKGNKFNYTPDSIVFHEDYSRFVHSGDAPCCSQWMYCTTGKTTGNGDHHNRGFSGSHNRDKHSGSNNSPDNGASHHRNAGCLCQRYNRSNPGTGNDPLNRSHDNPYEE